MNAAANPSEGRPNPFANVVTTPRDVTVLQRDWSRFLEIHALLHTIEFNPDTHLGKLYPDGRAAITARIVLEEDRLREILREMALKNYLEGASK